MFSMLKTSYLNRLIRTTVLCIMCNTLSIFSWTQWSPNM